MEEAPLARAAFSVYGGSYVRYYVLMIGFIEGDVKAVRGAYAIISAGGVGYKIFATHDTLAHFSEGA